MHNKFVCIASWCLLHITLLCSFLGFDDWDAWHDSQNFQLLSVFFPQQRWKPWSRIVNNPVPARERIQRQSSRQHQILPMLLSVSDSATDWHLSSRSSSACQWFSHGGGKFHWKSGCSCSSWNQAPGQFWNWIPLRNKTTRQIAQENCDHHQAPHGRIHLPNSFWGEEKHGKNGLPKCKK